MNEQHVDDLLDAYALGALEPDEIKLVEAHVKTCARCHKRAAMARGTAGELLLGAMLETPPPSLRAKILTRVHALATERSPIADPPPAEDAPTVQIGHVRRILRKLTGSSRIPEGNPVIALLVRLLASPDCVIWEVNSTEADSAAHAQLIGIPQGREAVLVTTGLKTLDAEHVYKVWLLRGSFPTPIVTFRVDSDGSGQQIVRTSAALHPLDVVMITREPVGRRSTPGPIVLMGRLSV